MWNINLRSKRQDFDTYFCHIHAILTPMIMTYTYIIQNLTKHVHSQFTQNCVKQLYQPHIPAWHSRGCDTVEISVNTIAWVTNTYWELAINKSNFENIMSDTVASIVFADCLALLRTRTYAGTVMNKPSVTLRWRHNGRDSVSNHQPHDCLLNRLFRRRSKETKKAPRHWPLCGEFTGDRWIPRTKGQ